MNKPSSTITSAGQWGFLTVFIMIALAIWAPEQYEMIQQFPGFEAALATAIAVIAGYLKKETVLDVYPK